MTSSSNGDDKEYQNYTPSVKSEKGRGFAYFPLP